MSSTEINIGLTGQRSSSRILKPPGGGHHDIFGAPETRLNNPRPKYDQQNSSNLNDCMNTTDPNILLEIAQKETVVGSKVSDSSLLNDDGGRADAPPPRAPNNITGPAPEQQAPAKGRIPPGGFSSGLW